MDVLTPGLDFTDFLQGIADAPERILLLDYDGTLAPFHIRPELATPYPEVRTVLGNIVRAGGTRVVIVSGRRAEELLPLLPLDRRPEIWGSHGREHLQPDGTLLLAAPEPHEREALEEAAAVLEPALHAGCRIERKPASVAVHWRGASVLSVAKLRAAASATWKALARDHGLECLPFDGGLELRVPGCTKGDVVRTVLADATPGSAVAYLGDDITDEDAFEAVKPFGIGVLVRPQFRQTQADVWLRPPRELVAFLKHWRVDAARE